VRVLWLVAMLKNSPQFRHAVLLNTLRSCQLFSDLPSSDLDTIASFVRVQKLERDQYLFREGSKVEGFYVVQTGAINVHRVSSQGKEQVIHVFRDGEPFAEAAMAGADGYPADARAIEESRVVMIPKQQFLELLRNRPALSLRILASMSMHLRVLVGRLDDLTLKDVETRLANWILKRCPRPLTKAAFNLELSHTKRVLAAEIGTVSETLSRTLARWREQKLVVAKGKSLLVQNPLELDTLMRRNLGES